MERLNDIEIEDKLNILRMIYPNLSELYCERLGISLVEHKLYKSEYNNIVKVIDINGVVLFEGDLQSSLVTGMYLILQGNNQVSVTNLFSNRVRKIPLKYISNKEVKILGNRFLYLGSFNETMILNEYLEIIWKNSDIISNLYEISKDSYGTWVSYNIFRPSRRNIKMRLNNKLNRADIFDIIEFEDGYSKIGVEIDLNSDTTIKPHMSTLNNVKYMLALNGKIIGTKRYDDILKLRELECSNYYYCFVQKYKDIYLEGVIDNNGEEIIEPIYNNIMYMGSGTFVVEKESTRQIINVVSGYKSVLMNKSLCNIHNTLPIIVAYESDNYYIYDTNARRFPIQEFTKYMNCCYCEQYSDIIKVNIKEDYCVYVTNNLEPITDIKLKNKFNTLDWKQIVQIV